MDNWQIAGGTVTGTGHLHPIRFCNNQDSFYWVQNAECLIAIVADGCSGSPHSEVGAKLGCRHIAHQLEYCLVRWGIETRPALLDVSGGQAYLLEEARLAVISELHWLSNYLGYKPHRVVKDFFLFTIVGLIITKEIGLFFSIGDGFIMVNDKILDLGKFPGNEPPYAMYDIIQDKLVNPTPELYKFQIHHTIPTEGLEHVVIGSDGVTDYLMPTLDYDISEFWQDGQYFQNGDQVRRRLATINKTNFVEVRGPLKDDTTLVVVRRAPEGE